MKDAPAGHTKELLVLSTTPAKPVAGGFVLDKKFVAGMALYRELWGGPVRCAMLADASADLPFTETYAAESLPFRLALLDEDGAFPARLLDGAAVVLASGDDAAQFEISRQCRRLRVPCVYTIENILETRLAITLRSGGPPARRYGAYNADMLAFFDTRTSEESLPSAEALEARLAGLGAGRPLRLAFSGRLDPIKGVDHLPRLMARLAAEGVAATLDIFGAGPLEGRLRAEIGRRGLADRIRLHGAVDFDADLVPFMKSSADLFVCCHRQSDPSCTYLETLACGVPIAGYANRALKGILEQADVGWAAPVGCIGALARTIRDVSRSPGEIAEKSRAALAFARDCAFEPTSARRVGQLRRLASLDPQPAPPASPKLRYAVRRKRFEVSLPARNTVPRERDIDPSGIGFY